MIANNDGMSARQTMAQINKSWQDLQDVVHVGTRLLLVADAINVILCPLMGLDHENCPYDIPTLWAMAQRSDLGISRVDMALRLDLLRKIAHEMLCPPFDKLDIPELWAEGAAYLTDRGVPSGPFTERQES